MTTPPDSELRLLLDQQKPTTALNLLDEGELTPQLGTLKAEALVMLDRVREANDTLDPLVMQMQGDDFSRAERLWAEICFRLGYVDGSILSARGAANAAQTDNVRAAAVAASAYGYARKNCWRKAEAAIREAHGLAPNDLAVLLAEARMRLEMDQRLEARAVYERMMQLNAPGAQTLAQWGLAHVALLLGAFDDARRYAETSLSGSDEFLGPLFTLGNLAMTNEDVNEFERVIEEIARRSPQSATLEPWRKELERMKARQADAAAPRKRLTAFPTTMQRRNYCGPCVIELVLRYWQGGLDLTNDQIAESVKFPSSGTPVYRMREFFHLIGFDTVRCLAPLDKIKQLIDAGYPAIVQQEYSNSSHVAVVIGYDDHAGALEFQDPMTHAITAMPYDYVNKIRRTYCDSAVVAFPRGQGHDKTLARMGLFDDPAAVWTDQASLALDNRRPAEAAALMERATLRNPAHALSWIMWLFAESDRWNDARRDLPEHLTPLAARIAEQSGQSDLALARQRFYDVLARAKSIHPEAEFVHQFEGRGAWMDDDLPRALEAYAKASEIDPGDATHFAAMAACHYGLRQMDKAREKAQDSLNRDPSLPGANVWMARAQAYQYNNYAMHYADCAAELAPDWWLAHQAYAEAAFRANDTASARRAVDAALALWPDQPEARALRGILNSSQGNRIQAALEFETVLAEPKLSPVTAYEARRELCRVLFGSRLYTQAIVLVQELLKDWPDDPWGLQFWADAYGQMLVYKGERATGDSLITFRHLSRQAIAANSKTTWVATNYLETLSKLESAGDAAEAAAKLRESYPEHTALIFWHGYHLERASQLEAAARVMVEALAAPNTLYEQRDLDDAIRIILDGLGLDEGEKAVLTTPVPQGGWPIETRERYLGLWLARHPDKKGERARELLQAALARDPNDAPAMLWLGKVTQAESDRESLFRRALRQAPQWSFARACLAEFLIDAGRADEALEFTAGYENETFDVMLQHGRALLNVGRYEEAVPAFERVVSWYAEPWSYGYYLKWVAEDSAGWHEAALETAQKSLTLFPDRARWHLYLAASLRGLGRFDEAEAAVAEGKAKGLSEAEVLEAQYETAWVKHDLDAGLQAVEALIALKQEKAGDGRLGEWEVKRLRLLLELERHDEARQFVIGENLNADGWGKAAWEAMSADAWPLCAEFADQALALDPSHFSGLFCKAEALRGLNRLDESISAYHQLREAHPDEHNSYEKLGLVLAVDGKNDEALTLADRAVQLGTFCPVAWATRGYAYFVRGDRALALSDLKTAWDRSDAERRREMNDFWWVLAALKGEAALAEGHKQKAFAEAKTDLDRKMLAQVERALGGA